MTTYRIEFGPAPAAAQPGMKSAECDAVGFRVRHASHSWEPEPDADLVRCPGYTEEPGRG